MVIHPYTRRFLESIRFPMLFLLLIWVVFLLDQWLDLGMVRYGIFPRRRSGLIGVLMAPLIHANLEHIISNSVPLLFLGLIMFYFYRQIAFSAFFWVYFTTGLWVWVAGRETYHVGASGLVYSFVCFIFYSGLFRRHRPLMALSLLMIFLYGSLIWGALPIAPKISWESHLFGALSGLLIAYYLRNEGPQRPVFDWENEPDGDGDPSDNKAEGPDMSKGPDGYLN